MPALPPEVLLRKLRAGLPVGTTIASGAVALRPGRAVIPGFGPVRFYLWTLTRDRSRPGARPAGEFKIQLILDDQPRGERGALELDDTHTALLGYSPDFGVFVGWDARLYRDFAYSANVQVREDTLEEARAFGWAVSPPRISHGAPEVRVAFTSPNLLHFLELSKRADADGLEDRWREAFFLANAPILGSQSVLPPEAAALPPLIELERQRQVATRIERDRRFAPAVKEQFDYACAICGTQLEIVHAAHIIAVAEPGSSDEVWNGVAMCPNHHSLYDAHAFGVDGDLLVHVHAPTVQFLRESNQGVGIEVLTEFDRDSLTAPHLWTENADQRARMANALQQRFVAAGF